MRIERAYTPIEIARVTTCDVDSGDRMPTTIVNYDGSITMTPQQVARPNTVEEIQEVLRDTARFPSPVRAMGSCHSLTPCVATDGTIIDRRA